jgi:hypothetical protein
MKKKLETSRWPPLLLLKKRGVEKTEKERKL